MKHIVNNALIRIEGVSGIPTPPFEKPNDDLDVWVLELPVPAPASKFFSYALAVLMHNDQVLHDLHTQGAQIYLHIDISNLNESPVRITPPFTEWCSKLNVTLEIVSL